MNTIPTTKDTYCIAEKFGGGKFGKFGELSAICQTKLVLTINNLLADLLIRQTLFCQMLETSQFAKHSPHQTFPLYGTRYTESKTCAGFNFANVFKITKFTKLLLYSMRVLEQKVLKLNLQPLNPDKLMIEFS